MAARLYSFIGGDTGPWRVVRMAAIAGEPLPAANRLAIDAGPGADAGAAWVLHGITSNERYIVREPDRSRMVAEQLPLARPGATCATLLPIRKSAAWWALAQEQRQRVFEDQARHASLGLEHFPSLARRLHHCRDLSDGEPFDFITWFEYAPAEEPAFDRLLGALRASAEWRYVEREIDIRLVRAAG